MTELSGQDSHAIAPHPLALHNFARDVGVALKLFLPYPQSDRFSADARVVALALAMLIGVAFLAAYAAALAKADGATFYRWGLYTVLTTLFVQTAVLFLAALSSRRAALTVLLTALPMIETIRLALAPVVELAESPLLQHTLHLLCLAALLRAVMRELDGQLARRLIVTAITGAALWGTAQLVRPFPLFNPVSDHRHERLNVERTYLKQERLVQEALDAVLASRPEIEDTYFVGFAPYSAQNVFENEVKHIDSLFRGKLGAEGRTTLLINSHHTVDDLPLANGHNLEAVLGGLANKMGPEDLLFLHLTSHGSSDHELSVYFDNLGLNDISAEELGEIVAKADLPWRVVVVSACYSGGYIDALKSPQAMVMTASRDDRQSFGCTHGRDYTYFGEAFYRDSLADHDYQSAFESAVEKIREKEEREDLTPSEPQIWIGDQVARKFE